MALRLGFGFGVSRPLVAERGDGLGGWYLGRRRRDGSDGGVRLAAPGERENSSRSGGELRTQLDQLQAEAEDTRSKANGARLRLLRLSEAAEQLQKQAALKVQSGKENEAREMLFQKKKIMKALENSKKRIELLGELSKKLSEAISLKESELIGNVASQPPISSEDTNAPVRIVSPKISPENESPGGKILLQNNSKSEDAQEVEPGKDKVSDSDYIMPVQPVCKEKQGATVDESKISFLMSTTSYRDFLVHVDEQLRDIENELIVVLRLSNLLIGSKQPENTNIKQTSEILQDISSTRNRIASIMQGVPEAS